MWSHCLREEVEPADVLDHEELASYHQAQRERAGRRSARYKRDQALFDHARRVAADPFANRDALVGQGSPW